MPEILFEIMLIFLAKLGGWEFPGDEAGLERFVFILCRQLSR